MRVMTSLRRRNRNAAFTLVEILIVVIILGILATVIIALLSNTTQDAGANALKADLRTIRSALEVYQAQHGTYPAVAQFEAQMTRYTDLSGNSSTDRTDVYQYGPYLLVMPNLPVGTNKGQNTVTGPTYAAGFGWSYNPAGGIFKANTPDADVDGEGKAFNTY
jgi:general secretion pathway protein G